MVKLRIFSVLDDGIVLGRIAREIYENIDLFDPENLYIFLDPMFFLNCFISSGGYPE